MASPIRLNPTTVMMRMIGVEDEASDGDGDNAGG